MYLYVYSTTTHGYFLSVGINPATADQVANSPIHVFLKFVNVLVYSND